MPPLISICLPNLNTRPYLPERMETILAQTVTDWELIICDSYSDDGAWEFFQQFRADPRVRLTQVPREGIFAGWNECLRRAQGRYIYFATSDDTSKPKMLEKLVAPLEHQQRLDLAVCDFEVIDEQGRHVDPLRYKKNQIEFFGDWLQSPSIRSGRTEFLLQCCLGSTWATMTTVLFRRSLVDRIGCFRTDRKVAGDFEWGLRACLASDIAFVPGELATWRVHRDQATRSWSTREMVSTMLACIQAVIDDRTAGLPDGWKQIPGWQEEIKGVYDLEYLDTFELYRGVARRHPAEFLRNLGRAACEQPAFLFRQIGSGFAGGQKFTPDRVAEAQRLLQLFQAAWPPTQVDATWHPPN